jgi:hypothetical protein
VSTDPSPRPLHITDAARKHHDEMFPHQVPTLLKRSSRSG